MAKIVEGENRGRPGRWLLDYRDSSARRRLLTFRTREDAVAALEELRRPLVAVGTVSVDAVGAGLKTYFLLNRETRRVKIGRTQNIQERISALETAAGTRLALLGVLDGDQEVEWHVRFAPDRVFGEWFNVSPRLALAMAETFGVRIGGGPRPVDLAIAEEKTRHKKAIAALISEHSTKPPRRRNKPDAERADSGSLPRKPALTTNPTGGING